MGEIRAVDDDENIRLALEDGLGGAADPIEDLRKARHDGHDPHDRDIAHGEQGLQPLADHRIAADALDHEIASAFAQREDQARSEMIAAMFAGDHEHAERSPVPRGSLGVIQFPFDRFARRNELRLEAAWAS